MNRSCRFSGPFYGKVQRAERPSDYKLQELSASVHTRAASRARDLGRGNEAGFLKEKLPPRDMRSLAFEGSTLAPGFSPKMSTAALSASENTSKGSLSSVSAKYPRIACRAWLNLCETSVRAHVCRQHASASLRATHGPSPLTLPCVAIVCNILPCHNFCSTTGYRVCINSSSSERSIPRL